MNDSDPPMTWWKVNGDGVWPVVDTIFLLQHRYPLHNILRPYIKTSYRLLNISRIFMNILLIFTNSKARQSCLSEKFFQNQIKCETIKVWLNQKPKQVYMHSKCTQWKLNEGENPFRKKSNSFPFLLTAFDRRTICRGLNDSDIV